MKKLILYGLIMLGCSHSGYSAIWIQQDIKSAVGFVYVERNDGEKVPIGTGFFVGVNTPDQSGSHVYFVTAAHVLRESTNTQWLPNIWMRLNARKGKPVLGKFELIPKGKSKNIFTHEDENIDIAVIPLLPSVEAYDFKILSEAMIPSKEQVRNSGINEGADIFFTGLFVAHVGTNKNYPIIRFGHISLMDDEPIDWDGKQTNLYLIEAPSFGGNSGAPVYAYLGPDRVANQITSGTEIKLIGVVKGSFGKLEPVQYLKTSGVPASVSNLGISAVIPSYYIRDILFGKEMKAKRGF